MHRSHPRRVVDAPQLQALLEDLTDPLATISEGDGNSEECCAQSTTFWYASCNFATVGRRQKMPPFFAQMASKQVAHFLKLKTRLLVLTGRFCRPKWDIASCNWYSKSGPLHKKKIDLLVNLSLFEGDGATSHSCTRTKGSIDASSSSLEVQMAYCFMTLVCKVGPFTQEKIYLLANLSFVRGAEGVGATSPSFSTVNESIDASNSSMEAPIATHHI